ncbi:synaptogyrin-3-like [Kryptolebias marmoratus]|uniref:Synaptogyrin n=1 Tax=Kryptolebias marmoratus TaxID=37003 RepID=A0A3Q3BER4_KRYMA|nr:synaptogyrin-3-like [Kryptolebias marmoratus]
MDGGGSFGAGRAGSTVDPVAFAKQPQTILRVLSWIFSLVLFACIVNEGYVNTGSERLHCVFNKNTFACRYAEFVGLANLLQCTSFFLLDYKFPSISSVKDRKKIVMLDIGFSAFWTLLYFVSFCFLAIQWSRTKMDDLPLNQGVDAARVALAFSFFSIITWAGLTVRAVQRFLLGTDMTLFTAEHAQLSPSGSAGGGTETTDPDQSSSLPENNGAPTNQNPIC